MREVYKARKNRVTLKKRTLRDGDLDCFYHLEIRIEFIGAEFSGWP